MDVLKKKKIFFLQVTPPTGRDITQKQNLTYPTQRIREVVKTLTRVHLNPISKTQVS